ncbi:MAG: hypothetical protein WC564_03245 [Patescibacteria group bacterium]
MENNLASELNSYFKSMNEVLETTNQILGIANMNLAAANTAAEMKEIIKAALYMDRNSPAFKEIKKLLWEKRMSNPMLVLSTFMNILDTFVSEEKPLLVDYSKTLEQTITDNYSCEDNNIISKNFPSPTEMTGKKVNVSTRLFCQDQSFTNDSAITEEDAISCMNDYGLRPANSMELLAYGISYPEKYINGGIIAINHTWSDGYRKKVLFLDFWNATPEIKLIDGYCWKKYYRILGISK